MRVTPTNQPRAIDVQCNHSPNESLIKHLSTVLESFKPIPAYKVANQSIATECHQVVVIVLTSGLLYSDMAALCVTAVIEERAIRRASKTNGPVCRPDAKAQLGVMSSRRNFEHLHYNTPCSAIE
jgi:hypothetical protein